MSGALTAVCDCGHDWSAHAHDDNFQPCGADCDCEFFSAVIPYWTCPYLARWEGRPCHDPNAVCAFGCVDEPACVTGGPWQRRGAE